MEDKDALLENLADAGCDRELTEQFLSLVRQGRKGEALGLLAQHRKTLLEHCYTAEKKIDCLDYLVYHMGRQANEQ